MITSTELFSIFPTLFIRLVGPGSSHAVTVVNVYLATTYVMDGMIVEMTPMKLTAPVTGVCSPA